MNIQTTVPAPAGEVFDHFVDARRLQRWWPPEAVTDPVNGGEYTLTWAERGWTLEGTYLEVDRPHVLSFTWSWRHDDLPPRTVRIEFASEDNRTHVTITHEAGDEAGAASYREGWEFFLGRLAEVVSAPTIP
ncbi:MAG: SRPBCC domain-containing protein [Acidimicrobiia bacterium]|nr:SRPBCC domain-containing protein [Acidimicrobiia bacterium]